MLLHIKHSRKVYDIEVDESVSGQQLKELVFKETGVPPERQKLIAKGKQVKPDSTLQSLNIVDGQTLMMVGTAQPPPAVQRAIDEKAKAEAGESKDADHKDELLGSAYYRPTGADEEGEKIPVGLTNIGNTCYANAILQALHTVPELGTALTNYKGVNPLIKSWAQLLPKFSIPKPLGTETPTPYSFLNSLRQKAPQFGEIGELGSPKQQDAEELWTILFSELNDSQDAQIQDAVADFSGSLDVEVKKLDGTTTKTTDSFNKLYCHINIRTNFLRDGLLASLSESRETGEGSGSFETVTKRVSSFPKYLTVQFVRFFWRKDTKTNSKILRKVAFPLQLDIGTLATDELVAKVAPAKQAFRELENAVEESKRNLRRSKFRKLDALDSQKTKESAELDSEETNEEKRDKEKVENLRKVLTSKIEESHVNPSHSPLGIYNLQAIVTHQGMSADSGHYQCFTRNTEKANSWWRFNDDTVTEVEDSRIAQLAGGGASDSALILLYKSAE